MTDIHRGTEVARLTQAITEAPLGLSIVSVSGPGGVGKSYLVNHVLTSIRQRDEDVVVLDVDGSDKDQVHDFVALVERLAPIDGFDNVRKVARVQRELIHDAERELVESGQPEEVRKVVTGLLRLGRTLNDAIPKSKEYVNAEWLGVEEGRLHEILDKAFDLARGMDSLKEAPFPKLRGALGLANVDRIKRDLHAVMAEALVQDLIALTRPPWWTRLKGESEPGRTAVLWFDDYEVLCRALGPWLTGKVVRMLAGEPDLRVVLLFVGRMPLQDTDTSWARNHGQHLSPQREIALEPFDEASALDYLSQAGIEGERAQRIWTDTRGFPFLLELVVEEATDSSVGTMRILQRFYERTTHWMQDAEREWFERICYLDVVNEDTLGAFFPPERVGAIWSWFIKEPSICDPRGDDAQVPALIRDKTLEFLKKRSPSRHAEMLERGRAAGAPA